MNNSPPAKAPPRTKSAIQAQRKRARKRKKKVSAGRQALSWLVSAVVGIAFTVTMALIIQARHTSFYGEPLREKVVALAQIHLHGLPENAEERARVVSGIPDLYLLPANAVLQEDIAARFTRLGIQFAYVPEDVRPGNGRYMCKATDTDLIPAVAWNIAAALHPIPDEALQALDLKYIIFCGDLYHEKSKVGGFPVPVNDLMMLNLTHRTQNRDIQELFLHEFYHLVEARNDLTHDPEWDNRYGTGYRSGYAGNTGPANSRLGTGNYGFLNRYSESFPYEDRAEIFAMLMLDRPGLIQFIMSRQDELLYAKARYVAQKARQHLGLKIEPF